MPCIKPTSFKYRSVKPALRLIAWLLAALFFVGCATTDKPKKRDKKAPEQALSGAVAAIELIPSPYVPGEVPEPARKEFAKIKSLMQDKKWEQAKGLLELMAETYPTLSGPYVNLGICHAQIGNMADAEKALKYALEVNQLNFDAYAQLGLVLREQGRFQDAEANYLAALALWPHHLDSTYNLGILYDLYMGRFEEALKYYNLSLQISGGEDRTLRGWIADLERRMGAQ